MWVHRVMGRVLEPWAGGEGRQVGARGADSCPLDLDGDEARGGGLSYYPEADGTENDL